MTGLRFFFCVHSVQMSALGTIRGVTELRCRSPWILGPAYAATHAFVAWTHGDGIHYRLDGQPGGAKPALWAGVHHKDAVIPHAAWELLEHQPAALARAIQLVGKPYDGVEALAQLLPGIGTAGFWDGGSICTGICTDVLAHTCAEGEALVKRLPSLLPEHFGQGLTAADKKLLARAA